MPPRVPQIHEYAQKNTCTMMCSGFGLATVMALDRQGWILLIAAVLLALISLFTSGCFP